MIVRLMRYATAVALLACLAGGALPAAAQQPVEVSFYYPVAVGGPVTKIIDGLAADFQKEALREVVWVNSGTFGDDGTVRLRAACR
jgi:ABC-type glycerol-3-phosphate transport system substrate-binding protein